MRPPVSSRFDAILRRQRRRWYGRIARFILTTGLILVSFGLVGLLDVGRLASGLPAVVTLGRAMFPPDFSRVLQWVGPTADTIAMSIAGTAIAIVLSLPLSLLAARNISPHPAMFYGARLLLNVARAIPELILGMILVAAVGFGKLPGTLALGIHSVGMVGKFFAESIELSEPAPIEAARAVGATEPQVIVHSLLPQIFAPITDVTFYRWEYNLRASLVLGAVGAGGLGLEIISALRVLKYKEVSALLLIVLGLVTIVDSLSSYLRRKFTTP